MGDRRASRGRRSNDPSLVAKVTAVFRSCDVDGNGFIEREELAEVLRRIDPGTFTPARVTTLISAADLDHDGKLSYEEFFSWLFGGSDHARDFRRGPVPKLLRELELEIGLMPEEVGDAAGDECAALRFDEPCWERNPTGQPHGGEWKPCSADWSAAAEILFQKFLAGSGPARTTVPVHYGGSVCFRLFSLHVRIRDGRPIENPIRRVIAGVVTHPPPNDPHPWYQNKVARVEKMGGAGDWLTNDFFFRAFQEAVRQDGGALDFSAEELFNFQYSSDFRSAKPKLERRGGVLYNVPVGWKRFALNVKGKYADGNGWMRMDGRSGEWAVAYHGTKWDVVPKIIRAVNGFRVGIRQGPNHCKLKDSRTGVPVTTGIFCTPNLEVIECYANGEEDDSGYPPVKLDGHTLLFALQCRVRPGAIQRPRNTAYMKTCNDEEEVGIEGVFEWVVESPADIRPYAVLVRDMEGCPNHKTLGQCAGYISQQRPKPGAFDHIPGKLDPAAQRAAERRQIETMDRACLPPLAREEVVKR